MNVFTSSGFCFELSTKNKHPHMFAKLFNFNGVISVLTGCPKALAHKNQGTFLMLYLYLPLLSPLVLIAAALYASRHPGIRPGRIPQLVESRECPRVACADAYEAVAVASHLTVAERHLENGPEVDPSTAGGDSFSIEHLGFRAASHAVIVGLLQAAAFGDEKESRPTNNTPFTSIFETAPVLTQGNLA